MEKDYKDKMNQVYLSIGSNLGDREEELRSSVKTLIKMFGELELSSVYETPPWGFESDQHFLNMCVGFKTAKTVREILDTCHLIEKEQGRIRETNQEGYSSRTVDLDILYYNCAAINDEQIQIPHPRLYARNFVLYPLSDIASTYIDPVKNETVESLKETCNDESSIILYKKKLLTFL